MHPSALQIGQKFLELYWNKEFKRILDVGARDINGSLRTFCPAGAEYIGIDLEGGAGVDVVLKDPYDYPFPDEHFDLIVSTSCFEHDGMFWLSFLEQLRVLSKSGSLYINAPSNGAYHGYPYDNWRFYPDASLALEAWARRNGREAFTIESFIGPQIEMGWNDCVMIFQKQVPANPEWHCVFDFFPGSYNIRKLGHQGVINFASHPQDEQIIWALSAKVADLSALIDRHAFMNRDPELTVVGGVSPNPVPGDRIEPVLGACPNFGKLMSGVGDFATRLAEIKSAAAVSFRWYAYHTLPNLEHIEPLIPPDYDFLFQPGKRYADIGCGDGDLAYYLESQGNELHLYDFGPTNMNQVLGARYLKNALGSAAKITELDLDSQFQIDEKYDLIFFLGILYHLKNPFYVLENLSYAGRFMLLSTRIARHFSAGAADVSGVPAAYLLDPRECNNDPTNYWIFTEAGLKRLADRTGWDVVGFRTVGDKLRSNPQDKDRDERAFVLLRSCRER